MSSETRAKHFPAMMLAGAAAAVALTGTVPAIAESTAAAPADLSAKATYAIPAQLAGDALNAFSRQSGYRLLFPYDAIAGKKVRAISGTMTADQALRRLLADTGLKLVSRENGTITLGGLGESGGSGGRVESLGDGIPFSLASGQVSQFDEGKEDAGREIVVTGTRIRGVETPAPTRAISRQDIKDAGYLRTEEIFSSLPQNFAAYSGLGSGLVPGGLAGEDSMKSSAIDLRGLGPESTLVLLNGKRRAGNQSGRVVDIAAIPIGAIERVDIVSGGKSSVYGSDAVAGVVNFVLRRSYDGAATRAAYTPAQSGGGERYQVGQTAGLRSDKGGFIVDGSYAKTSALNGVRSGAISPLNPFGVRLSREELLQVDALKSLYFAGEAIPNEHFTLYSELQYSDRRIEGNSQFINPESQINSFSTNWGMTGTYSASIGSTIKAGPWLIELNSNLSGTKGHFQSEVFQDFGPSGSFTIPRDAGSASKSMVKLYSTSATGPLFNINGYPVQIAMGAEHRKEGFSNVFLTTGVFFGRGQRSIDSTFAEMTLPLVSRGGIGLRSLQISAAGRIDKYSDFGTTRNPEFGAIWKPFAATTISGSYSTAFRAPDLATLFAGQTVLIIDGADPLGVGGQSPLFSLSGGNRALSAEKARTWTVSVNQELPIPKTTLGLSYLDVEYKDRLASPFGSFGYANELANFGDYPGIIYRNPSPGDVASLLPGGFPAQVYNFTQFPFDPATQDVTAAIPGIVLLDVRTQNIATEKIRAIDLSLASTQSIGSGQVSLDINASYMISYDRKLLPTSSPETRINRVGRPSDLRIRSKLQWRQGVLNLVGYINYVGSYVNQFTEPSSRVSSWTTVDATVEFLDLSLLTQPLRGFAIALSGLNVLNARPPLVRNSVSNVTYDSTNSNALGRVVTLSINKKW